MPFCLRLTVYDEGVDSPVLRLATRVDSGSESGRGAWIVDACTDDWGIDVLGDEDKCTWALFAVRPKSSLVHDI